MSAKVLVVDDDPQLSANIARMLTTCGYEVRIVREGGTAIASLRDRCPDLLIAALDMAGMDGLELCRRVRETSAVPIIIVSDDADSRSEVAALDSGADDYLLRPLTAERLVARVKAALRRGAESPATSALGVGAFEVDFHDRRVRVQGQPVRLTPKEFDLFVFMARHPNRVLHHKTLLGAVWGEGSQDQSEYLRVFIGQLRKKLEADPSNPRYLTTEPWVGYRFNPTGAMQ
jgi:two-component system KDP operon response regulator KdpE